MIRPLLLLLLTALPAWGQSATVAISFPAMPISRVRPGLLMAAREPAPGTLTFPDGKVLQLVNDAIPATSIRGIGLRKTVDTCLCSGTIEDGGTFVMQLPPEAVRLRGFTFWAMPIWCPTTVTLADGTVMTGTVYGPACPTSKIGRGSFLAAPVTYYGSVSK